MKEGEKNAAGWVVAVILGIILFVVWGSSSNNQTISDSNSSDSSDLQSQLDDASSCLSEANSYISDLQNTIDDASSAVDGNFDELHEAIANLEYDSPPTCLSDY